MSGFNYDKFDKIGKDFEEEEKKEKEYVRAENHAAYNKRRQDRIDTWEEEQRRQGKDVEKLRREYQKQSCGCMSQQMAFAHSHGHGDHSHDAKEVMRKAQEKKKPDIPLPEKNRRKLIAIEATRVDGGKYFKKGDYETALAIYERGLLISNGIYGIPDKQWEDVNKMEAKLDLNIAACKLKLQEWVSCIEYCERAIAVESSTKAYYRMAEAYIGMGEYEKALEKNAAGRARQPGFTSLQEQEQRIKRLHAIQREKAKKETLKMAKRLQKRLKKHSPSRGKETEKVPKVDAQTVDGQEE